jgi:hypothetical protein
MTARVAALFVIALFGFGKAASAQSVTITSGAAPVVIAEALAGHASKVASDNSTRMRLVVIEAGSTLFAHVEHPLPPGVTLRVKIQAPFGSVSLPAVAVDATPRELLHGIPVGTHAGLTITYEISAEANAGVIPQSAFNVVFSLSTHGL